MVTQLSKPIKPKKLKVDKVRQRLLNALEKEGKLIAREFQKTMSSWQGVKPKFEVRPGESGDDITKFVIPTGTEKAILKWIWLDQGTKPHVIRAKNVPRLIFKTGYNAKTRPGFFGSFPGGSFGPTVSKVKVNHPGTQARNWSKLVLSRRRKRFIQNMNKAARVTT